MTHIFVSHASKDDDTVTRIHDALEKATGRELWVDHKDIGLTDHWQTSIDESLRDCESLLLVISRASMKSPEVTAEWRDALLRKHPMYIAIIDDVPLEDISSRLRIISMVNLHKDWEIGMAALIATISGEALPADAPVSPARVVTGEIQASLLSVPIQGREADLREITAHLNTGRPTQILGVGGLGKSRLAAELAFSYPAVDGAIWLRCDDTSNADDFVYRMREHFELDPTAERSAVLAQFKQKKRLVVIDNAESVPDDDPRRAEFTKLVNQLAANGARVLLTSRLEWEDIEPPYRTHRPAALSADAGTEVARVMADAFDAPAVKNDAATFAEAARQHAGLIDWGARQAIKRPLNQVLNELRELRGERLEDALDAMIHSTLRAMKEAEGSTPEDVLRRLAVCRGGFTLDVVQFICANYLDKLDDALWTLQTWQFVRFDQAAQRYRLDPLVEAVMKPNESAHQPHYDFYKALAYQHDNKQDYFGLDVESDNLTAAFEWAIQGDGVAAYWMANACSWFLANRGRFEQRMDWLERVSAQLSTHPDASFRAGVQNDFGILYQDHPTGSRPHNLRKAIAAYETALEYFTPQVVPLDYAMTQHNLGTAYQALAQIEDHLSNLRKAITAYAAALVYRTPQDAPLAYADTQIALGNAYRNLSEIEDREGNLHKAISAHETALIYHTPQAAPLRYAMTRNNLGAAYLDLAQIEDRLVNLRKAVATYEAALEHYTPQAAPLDYAGTQYNLALVYRSLSEVENREDQLNKAIHCYKEALRFRTPEAAPIAYANTMWGMGIDYQSLSDIPNAIACWREAERIFRQMDMVEEADLMRQ